MLSTVERASMAVLAWSANTSYCLIASTILPFAAVIISVGFNVDMTDVLPGPDGDVTPDPDGDVTPGPDGDVTPGSDADVTPVPNGDVTPVSDGDVTPGPDGNVTPGSDGLVGGLDVVRHSSVKSRPPGLKHQISLGFSLMYEQLSGHEESSSIKLMK